MENFFCAMLIGFTIALALSPLIIKLIKKLKCKQNILEYVKSHQSKQGTPTMGGLIFIIAAVAASLIFWGYNNSLMIVCLTGFFAFGFLGFLDDYIKIRFRRNLGLKAYQKIIGQLAISTILIVYFYLQGNLVGFYIPFTTTFVNMGFWYIPFMIIALIATTNSVNLIDGLDGLAGSTSLCYLAAFSACTFAFIGAVNYSPLLLEEHLVLLTSVGALIGALLAYLIFNCFPASIFMGDTGSLALGGFIGLISIATGQVWWIIILGIPFVVTALSVIAQVLYYKLTKKRIFKMAPLHHHLELCNMNETKIVSIYTIITLIVGVGTFLVYLLVL